MYPVIRENVMILGILIIYVGPNTIVSSIQTFLEHTGLSEFIPHILRCNIVANDGQFGLILVKVKFHNLFYIKLFLC